MRDKEVPDATISQPREGEILYQQNLYVWAKNSGQSIYQETISVNFSPEESAKPWQPVAMQLRKPVLTISTEEGSYSSSKKQLVQKMADILQQVMKDGIVDTGEKAAMTAIIQDAMDDRKLNGSVPNLLIKIVDDID